VSEPFTGKATITLHGGRNSFPLAISNDFEAGNKALVNTGTVKMYGAERKDRLTRLTQPALKGS